VSVIVQKAAAVHLHQPLTRALAKLGLNVASNPQSKAIPFRTDIKGGFAAAKDGWLKKVSSYPNLSGSDLAVAVTISTHLNSKTGKAWPSYERIANLTNRDNSTVWRSVKRLIRLHLLEVKKGRGRNKSNQYWPALGSVDCDPKTLRRRNNNSASWQRKPLRTRGQNLRGILE